MKASLLPEIRLASLLWVPLRFGLVLLALLAVLSLFALVPLAIAWINVEPKYHFVVIGGVVLLHLLSGQVYAWQVRRVMANKVSRLTIESEHGPKAAVRDVRLSVHHAEPTTMPRTSAARASFRRLMNRRGAVFTSSVLLGLVLATIVRVADWASRGWPAVEVAFAGVTTAIVLALVFFAYRRRGTVSLAAALLFGLWSHGLVLFVNLDRVEGSADPVQHWLPVAVYFGAVTLGWGGAWLLDAWQRRRRSARRLLVLRTFGVERQTESLFAHIAGRWSSIGPLATIVDPTYARFRFRRTRRTLFLTMVAVLWTPLLFVFAEASRSHTFDLHDGLHRLRDLAWTLTEELRASLESPSALLASIEKPALVALETSSMVAVYYALFLVVVLAWAIWRLHATATQSTEAVRHRLALETSMTSFFAYRSFEIACFDNVWLATVKELVPWADVILFDIRGYRPGRDGCDLEIEQLLDRAELRRVVFLADHSTDLGHLERVVKASARTLDAASPQVKRGSVVLTVFVSERRGRALRKEAPSIFGLLSEVAALAPVPRRPTWRTWVALTVELIAVVGWAFLVVTWFAAWSVERAELVVLLCVSVLLLMTSYRLRDLLVRQGSVRGFWRRSLWMIVFDMVVLAGAIAFASTL